MSVFKISELTVDCGMPAGRNGGNIPGGGKPTPGGANDGGGINGRNCRRAFLADVWPEL